MSKKNSDVLAVMIAKKNSTRLHGKNTKFFNGMPMFMWNLQKLVDLFENVVLDSDCDEMLKLGTELGVIGHKRKKTLLGNDIPSVPIFKSISDDYPDFSHVLNLQANSPNTSTNVIKNCANIILLNEVNEVLTNYSSGEINGSVWCFTRERLQNYGDFYKHYPNVLVHDDSIDIHTEDDFLKALKYE